MKAHGAWRCSVVLILALLALPAAAAERYDLLIQGVAGRPLPSERNSVLRYHGVTGEPMGPFVASGAGGLADPHNPTFGPDGNLYVISGGTQSIKRYDGRNGEYMDDFVAAGSGGFDGSPKIAFGPDDNLYAANFGLRQVLRFSGADGSFLGVAAQGQGMVGTCGIAFGPDGMLYVLDNPGNARVLRFNSATGEFLGEFIPPGRLFNSCDLAFGPDGHLYITDANARTVQRWNGTTGAYLGVFATMPVGEAGGPSGVAFNPDGDMFVNTGNTLQFDGTTGAFIKTFVVGNGGFANFLPYPTSDEPLPTDTFAVTNTKDSGPGSLRKAVQDANLIFPGTSRIIFNIPGDGVQTIVIPDANPIILTRPTELDGFSQPGTRSNSLATGIDAKLLIQIRGPLRVVSDDCKIRGLVLNTSGGIGLEITGGGNVVEGCFIGTDPTGTFGLGNESAGLALLQTFSSKTNRVGGPNPVQRNLISGNQGDGVFVSTSAAAPLIQNNYIGTDVTGRRPLGNRIGVHGGHAIVGGTNASEGNVIAFNETGVWAESDPGLSVLRNSIFGNRDLGVDLGTDTDLSLQFPDGPTPNDDGDTDTGANGFQNAPLISSATSASGMTTIQGTLSSKPNTAYRIEFFANSSPDVQCFGEGETFVGSRDVTTDATGSVAFSATFPGTLTFVSATATDPAGNTSEYSVTFIPSAGPFAAGDVFVSGTRGVVQHFGVDGQFKGCLEIGTFAEDTYGMAFGPDGTIYVTGRPDNAVTHLSNTGEFLGLFASGYEGYSWWIGFDSTGNAYISDGGNGAELRKFSPQGSLLREFDTITADFVGLTTFAIQSDDRTLLYATEGVSVFGNAIYENRIGRFDLVANQPLADLAANLPGLVRSLDLTADGRVLAAIEEEIILLDSQGQIQAHFDVPGEDFWNSVALGEDGQSFWAGSDGGGYIYRFDLASGQAVQRIFVGEVFEVSLLVKPGVAPPPPPPGNPQTFVVSNTNGSGPGSLRAAITAANATLARDTITFNISGAGPHMIRPQSPLPEITAPLVIDGYTQPGSQVNASASAALQTLRIVLDGSQAGALTDGLVVAADACVVKGLAIVNFFGNGLVLRDSTGTQVQGNYLGVEPAGTAAGNGKHGLLVWDSGGTDVGHDGAASVNLISANFGAGIAVTGADTTDNTVAWNLIGTSRDGASAMGNGAAGILIAASSQHIGANMAGSGGNLIAFNRGAGVEVFGSRDFIRFRQSRFQEATGVRITGNRILSNDGLGIDLIPPGMTANDPRGPDEDDGPNNRLNFPLLNPIVPGSQTATGSLFTTPESDFRVEVFANAECDASGNGEGAEFVGAGEATTDTDGNGQFSVALNRPLVEGEFITAVAIASNDDTSEFAPCLRVSPPADLQVSIAASANPAPARSDVTFTVTVKNNGPGPASNVALAVVLSPRINFVSTSAPCGVGFGGAVSCGWDTLVSGGEQVITVVGQADFAGEFHVTASVTAAELEPQPADNDAAFTLTATSQPRTLVVTNTNDSGAGSLRAAIQDANANGSGADTITFDIPGAGVRTIQPEFDLPNLQVPVVIDGYSQLGAQANTLAEGTDATVLIAIDGTNVFEGLLLAAPGCVVRGLAIHSCRQAGIRISDNNFAPGDALSVIEGCFIGTDASGLAARGNLNVGVEVVNGAARIGGTTPAARNLISANGDPGNRNTGQGVNVDSNGEAIIQGNLIGTDATGASPLGNLLHGVQIRTGVLGAAVVGGREPGAGNVIAFNHGSGVSPTRSQTVATVVGNSIFANGLLGIGRTQPTPNDPDDPLEVESGQAVQNHPLIASVTFNGASTRIAGTLSSRPDEAFTLDFYANSEADQSFFGEGEFYLGSVEVTTDASGGANFNASFDGQWQLISATATDALGRTSEFSPVALPDPGLFGSGDLFIYLRSGFVQWRRNDGSLAKLLDTGQHPQSSLSRASAATLDRAGNLYVAGQDELESSIFKFDSTGRLAGMVGGDFEGDVLGLATDNEGNLYAAVSDRAMDIRKYSPDGQFIEGYDVDNESAVLGGSTYQAGVRFLQIAADLQTLYYTSEQLAVLGVGTVETKSIKRYNLATRTQLADFASNLPGSETGQFQLLSGGGALIADIDAILRLNGAGQVTQTYDLPDEDEWLLLAVDPTGARFWASYPDAGISGVRNFVYGFDLATGNLLATLDMGPNSIVRALAMAPTDALPPAPRLSVAVGPDGRVRVAWPERAADFQLQTTTSLSPPVSWSPITTGIAVENGRSVFRADPAGPTRFYRLQKP